MSITFGLIGQSNGQGTTGPVDPNNLSPTVSVGTAREALFKQVGTNGGNITWVDLFDPMSRTYTTITSRRSNTGSPWPAFVNRLNELTSQTIDVAHYCVSGTAVAPNAGGNQNWSPTGVLRNNARLHFQKMLDSIGVGTKLDWIITTIGETDGFANIVRYNLDILPNGFVCADYPNGYSNPTNKPDLFTLYAGLITYYQAQFPGVKFLINQTGMFGNRTVAERAAGALMPAMQRVLAETIPNVYTCGTATGFTIENGKVRASDTVHYTQVGANELGVADAEVIAAVIAAV